MFTLSHYLFELFINYKSHLINIKPKVPIFNFFQEEMTSTNHKATTFLKRNLLTEVANSNY